VAALLEQTAWVMDGNYGGTQDARIAVSDTVIFLDLPRRVCLWRVIRRWLRYRGRSRPDMAAGCPEQLSFEFLWWIWNYPVRQRPGILTKLRSLRPDQRAIVLRSAGDARTFLQTVGADADTPCAAAGVMHDG
jgi:adenylate kinase family enzyme